MREETGANSRSRRKKGWRRIYFSGADINMYMQDSKPGVASVGI
jgi:hypothetical protein